MNCIANFRKHQGKEIIFSHQSNIVWGQMLNELLWVIKIKKKIDFATKRNLAYWSLWTQYSFSVSGRCLSTCDHAKIFISSSCNSAVCIDFKIQRQTWLIPYQKERGWALYLGGRSMEFGDRTICLSGGFATLYKVYEWRHLSSLRLETKDLYVD